MVAKVGVLRRRGSAVASEGHILGWVQPHAFHSASRWYV